MLENKTMKKRIEFLVNYKPPISKLGKEMVGVLSRMDLGISGVELPPTTENWSWSTTEKVDNEYIKKMKGVIQEAINSQGGELIKVNYLQ